MLCTVVVDDPIIAKNDRLRKKRGKISINRLIGSSSISDTRIYLNFVQFSFPQALFTILDSSTFHSKLVDFPFCEIILKNLVSVKIYLSKTFKLCFKGIYCKLLYCLMKQKQKTIFSMFPYSY